MFWSNAPCPKIFRGKIILGQYPWDPSAFRIQKINFFFKSPQISKRGSTLAAHISLKDPLPPFAIHILYRLDMRIHHLLYSIPIQKLSKWRLSDRFFFAIFGREPRLYSEISDFQNLSVLGDFYASYHLVCHIL